MRSASASLGSPTFLGLAFLLGVVIIWVGSSIAYQYVFHNLNYAKPFLATYVSTSLFTIYLIGFLFKSDWICDARPVKRVIFRCLGRSTVAVEQQALVASADNETRGAADTEDPSGAPKMKGMWEVMRISIVFCPIWFVANWSYNESLVLTTVSSATILASSSPLFTLLLTSVKERFSLLKLVAVCLTISGVVLVTITDAKRKKTSVADESSFFDGLTATNSTSTPSPLPSRGATVLGDLLSLLSAFAYGVYATALDRMIPDHEVVSTTMFFGFVGALNTILLWPLGLILSVTGVERFVMPSREESLFLLANGLIGTVLSDLLWLWSVLLTSPLITTVGISLTVPLAVISDVVLHGDRFAWQYLFGSGMVLLGFLTVTLHDQLHKLLLSAMRRWTPWCPFLPPEQSATPEPDSADAAPDDVIK